MRQILLVTTLFLGLGTSLGAFAAGPAVIVGYFSKEPKTAYDTKAKPFFTEQAHCPSCELRNLTPYNEKGEYDPAKLVETIKAVGPDVSFLFFDWNERSSDKNKDVADSLNKATEGKLLVAAAGVPPTNEGSCPLNRTLMGQVNDAIIIGELAERDRLLAQCYYGPEMLSAIRPPKEYFGQGRAPLLFAAKLANVWNRRKPADWPSYLRARKAKSKRIWTELEDFFPR